MKKKIIINLLLAVFVLPCIFLISGCIDKYKIEFICDNALYTTVETNGNEIIELPADPTKDNYVFDGWYYDKGTWQNEFYASFYENNKLEKNIRVYAKWISEEDQKIYNINYILDGGINSNLNPVTFKNTEEVILQEPTREFFDFKGWYTEYPFVNKIEKISRNTEKDIILIARWEPKENYFVSEVMGWSCDIMKNGKLVNCLGYNLYTTDISNLQVGDRIMWTRTGASFVTHKIISIDLSNDYIITSQTDSFAEDGYEPTPDAPISLSNVRGKLLQHFDFDESISFNNDIYITSDGITYSVSDNEITIEKIYSNKECVEIPSTIKNKRVKNIGTLDEPILNENSKVEKIILPENINTLNMCVYDDIEIQFSKTNNPDAFEIKKENSSTAESILNYSHIKNIEVGTQLGTYGLSIRFTEEGAKLFRDLTSELAATQGRIYLYIDNEYYTYAIVQTTISDGRTFLSGNFNSFNEANDFCNSIKGILNTNNDAYNLKFAMLYNLNELNIYKYSENPSSEINSWCSDYMDVEIYNKTNFKSFLTSNIEQSETITLKAIMPGDNINFTNIIINDDIGVYVRIKLNYTDNLMNFTLDENWHKDGDYYYYSNGNIPKPLNTNEKIYINISSLVSSQIANGTSKIDISLVVETIQSANLLPTNVKQAFDDFYSLNINLTGFTRDNRTFSLTVRNNFSSINFNEYVEINNRFSWDINGGKIQSLNIGDNTFFITVRWDEKFKSKSYTVTIRRRPKFEVKFNTNSETIIASQFVEEEGKVQIPQIVPEKAGFIFSHWDYNFETPITSSITINAIYVNDYSSMILSLNNNNLELDLNENNPTKTIIANISSPNNLISREVNLNTFSDKVLIEKKSFNSESGDTIFEITPLEITTEPIEIIFISKEGNKTKTLTINIIKSVQSVSLQNDIETKLFVFEGEQKDFYDLLNFVPFDTTQFKGTWTIVNGYDHQAEIFNDKLIVNNKGTADFIDIQFQSENALIEPIAIKIKVFEALSFDLYYNDTILTDTFEWNINDYYDFINGELLFKINSSLIDSLDLESNSTSIFDSEIVNIQDDYYVKLTSKGKIGTTNLSISIKLKNYDYSITKNISLSIKFSYQFKNSNGIDLITKINNQSQSVPSFDIEQLTNRECNQNEKFRISCAFEGTDLDSLSFYKIHVFNKKWQEVSVSDTIMYTYDSIFNIATNFIASLSGDYYIFINLTTNYNNALTVAYKIYANDTVAPTIQVNNVLTSIEVGITTKIPDITVLDEGEELTNPYKEIRFIGDNPSYRFNNSTFQFTPLEEGTFTFEYYAKDLSGNATISGPYAFTAKDTIKPVITLDRDLNADKTHPIIKVNNEIQPIILPGYTAEDRFNGIKETSVEVLTPSENSLKVESTIDGYSFVPTVDGIYTINYIAVDLANNKTVLTYRLKIGDNIAPSIVINNVEANAPSEMALNSILRLDLSQILVSDNGETKTAIELSSEYNNGYRMFTVKVTAPDGSNLNANVGSDYEYTLSKAGTYTITYTARDKAGNEKVVKKYLSVY